MAGKLAVLFTLALRSLATHKVSTAVVGSIIFFGTFLVVLGTSLLDSIERSMEQSVTSSIAGHLQVYSGDAHDDLALFGSGFLGNDDVGEIPDFAAVKSAVESIDNVKAVVPMGFQFNTVVTGNDLDRVLDALRRAVGAQDSVFISAASAQIRAIAADLQQSWERRLPITQDKDAVRAALADLTTLQSDAFWLEFGRNPETSMQFLDTHLAPLADDGQLIYLRNLGTDLKRFASLFDRFTIADGEKVPDGKRGFLFSKRVYERQIKNKVARELDVLHSDMADKSLTIADDPGLAERAKRLPRYYQRITFQVHPEQAAELTQRLRGYLRQPRGELNGLVQNFLTLTDTNFEDRYAFFYAQVAPLINLYRVNIGDTLTLRAYTRSGYVTSANVKVYGTFQFRGLERSDLAGAENLLDMVTFRDLYGYMTHDKRAELEALRLQVGLQDVNREDAEAALFGDAAQGMATRAAAFTQEQEEPPQTGLAPQSANERVYDEAAMNAGIALNAAVLLHNPSDLASTRAAIERHSQANGLNLRVADWQTASGMVGQFIVVVRIVLYVAIMVLFLVALVIMNNAMVMSTLERVTEIGTMRAMGAQRSFILATFICENLSLGIIAGALGAAAGALTVSAFGTWGIPAANDIMVFLFSGPRLYPTWVFANLAFGVGVILVVSLVSTLYPARLAAHVQPIVAMQAKG